MDEKYFSKDVTSLARRIYETVLLCIAGGVAEMPDVLLQINRDDHTVAIADDGDRLPNCGYHAVDELVNTVADGRVSVDVDAVARLTAHYATA